MRETESLGDQLKRNAATLTISVVCLIVVTAAAFKPPTEEIKRFSGQLKEERARLEAKAADDDKALLSNQTELRETQQKLVETEKALAENEEALRQTQADLGNITSPKRSEAKAYDETTPPTNVSAKLKMDIKSVRDALLDALRKLQSDKEAYKINAEGLAREQKSLDDVTNSLLVQKGEISVDKAEALKRDWEHYLPASTGLREITVGGQRTNPVATLLANVDEALSSDSFLVMQKVLQSETGELERTVEEIRAVEADILKRQQETVDLQHSILIRQSEIQALRDKK